MAITHTKVSAVADGADTSLVRPVDWNASHTVSGTLALDGVQFPAVQVPSAGVNMLDDYEEGTFTPTLSWSTSNGDFAVVYSTQTGRYTKIGRLLICHVELNCSTFTHTTASGTLTLNGLPFTAATLTSGYIGTLDMRVAVPPAQVTGYHVRVFSAATTAQFIYSRTSASSTGLLPAAITTANDPVIRTTLIYNV